MSARETAKRLGIKLDTLYAYVSRGLLHSLAVPDSRERRYRLADVERFRSARGDRAREALMPVIDSAISLIEHGRFYYRGVDALTFAETATLEDAAALLWGVNAWAGAPHPFPLPAGGERENTAAASSAEGLIERCQIRLAALSRADLAALDLTRAGVVCTGRTILTELTALITGEAAGSEPAHRQLATHWRLDTAGADVVRRCLVLVADHELNASTFVARCVASTGATPYAVVAAALAALSGRRHGGASARAEALFRDIGAGDQPMAAMAARLARGETLPGLGQRLYPDGDPRTAAILTATGAALPTARERLAAAADAAHRLTGEHPNVDFALGAAVTALGLPRGAAFALFVIGRAVGWLAHAIEQYESQVLIRPRARYTGRRPTPSPPEIHPDAAAG